LGQEIRRPHSGLKSWHGTFAFGFINLDWRRERRCLSPSAGEAIRAFSGLYVTLKNAVAIKANKVIKLITRNRGHLAAIQGN
jgi:hypothetical protein